jgi:hypothetical protein
MPDVESNPAWTQQNQSTPFLPDALLSDG